MQFSKPDFTLAGYAKALRSYRSAGYAVTGFAGYLSDPRPEHLILRHDIDNSIEQALRVAQVDASAGCSSTFFLRVHARGYNLLSLQSLQIIREMEELGHEVQLHLEAGFGDWLGADQLNWAERQRAVFEAAVGRPLGGFSAHEPARMGGIAFSDEMLELWGADVKYHAYEDRFVSPSMKYLSDSSGNWREGHFAEWVGREPLFQVLTHPFWWYEKIPAENY